MPAVQDGPDGCVCLAAHVPHLLHAVAQHEQLLVAHAVQRGDDELGELGRSCFLGYSQLGTHSFQCCHCALLSRTRYSKMVSPSSV